MYTCVFADKITDPDDVCTAKNICDDDPRITSWSINYNDPNSLHNWVERLDLMCKPDWVVSMLSTAFWIGYIATMLWMPRIADVHGRKMIFAIGVSVSALLYTVVVFSKNFYLTLVAIFFFGVTNTIRTIIGFVYMSELMPKSSQTIAVTVFWIIDGLVYLFVVLYFWKISDQCMYLISVGYGFMIIAGILVWFLPESPVYLLSLNKTEQAIKVMS